MFTQMEGLLVDEKTTFADLKGTLQYLIERLFGEGIKTRFRPSFFPFVEPGAEVDMTCLFCKGKGCRTCGNSGWIEILGAGMVHKNVLRNCGIDPEKYQGFAFGIGVDRVAMLKYGIHDIRFLFENDTRLLRRD
jgi:phenylalanyl-tRNA synthetase alpha chain